MCESSCEAPHRAAAGWLLIVALLAVPVPASGQVLNRVLHFTGPGSGYMEVPDAADLNPTDAITLELWVYLESDSYYGAVDCCPSLVGKDWQNGYWLGLAQSRTSLSFYGPSRTAAVSTGTIPIAVWTHVAVTYTAAGGASFYINGVLDSAFPESLGPLRVSAAPLRIGNDVAWDATPQGYVEEVRVWSVARTASEITVSMTSEIDTPVEGLVAVWHLNSDTGDAVGSHDGVLHDAAVFEGGGPCDYSYFIPAGAHQAGAAGSQWVTDITLVNNGAAPANPVVYLLRRDADNSEPAWVGYTTTWPQRTLALTDIVAIDFLEQDLAAAFHVCSDNRLLVTSRTYNRSVSGTFGQGIPGVLEERAISGEHVGWLGALQESGEFRTNLGFVNTTAATATVRVELFAATGASLGSLEYQLPPYGHIQRNRILRELTSDVVYTASARVTAVTGAVFAYASVVDNATGDGTFMLAE